MLIVKPQTFAGLFVLFKLFWRYRFEDSGKPFFLCCFPFDEKMKLKKWWQALQVNLGHFIKNTTKRLKDQVLATGTCWVTMVWVFWYYSSYSKNHAFSAFQHRENITTCAYETIFFLFSALHCCSGLSVKIKSVWPEERKKTCTDFQLSFKSLPKKRFKCHIRGNMLVLYWAQTGCTDWVNFSLIGNKRNIFFCFFVVEGKREKKNNRGKSLLPICSASLLSNKHQGQLHKHIDTRKCPITHGQAKHTQMTNTLADTRRHLYSPHLQTSVH